MAPALGYEYQVYHTRASCGRVEGSIHKARGSRRHLRANSHYIADGVLRKAIQSPVLPFQSCWIFFYIQRTLRNCLLLSSLVLLCACLVFQFKLPELSEIFILKDFDLLF